MLSTIVIALIAVVIAGIIAHYSFKDNEKRYPVAAVLFIVIFFLMRFYLFPHEHLTQYQSATIDKYPIYAVIEKYYPEEFSQYIDYVKSNIPADSPTKYDDEVKASGTLVNYALEQSLPYASNESVYHLLTATIKFYKMLYDKNPEFIIMMEFPNRPGVDYSFSELSSAIPESSVIEMMRTKQAIIESGSINKAEKGEIVQLSDAMNQQIDTVFSRLTKEYGDAVIANTFVEVTLPLKNPSESAKAIIALYEGIAALDHEEAATILKALYAEAILR